MKLRGRMTLAMTSLSLAAAAVLALTDLGAIHQSFTEERKEANAELKVAVEQNLTGKEEYLKGMLDGLAQDLPDLPDRLDPEGQKLLLREAEQNRSSPELGALLDVLAEQTAQRQLDVLDLVRNDGRVLASAHWRSSSLSLTRTDKAAPLRIGQTGIALVQIPGADGSGQYADGTPISSIALTATGRVDSELILTVGLFLEGPHAPLRALAGFPDSATLSLPDHPEVVARAVAASNGEVALVPVLVRDFDVLPSFDAPAAVGRSAHLRLDRLNEPAQLERGLFLRLLMITALLVVGSALLARMVAARLTAPIDELVAGAHAIAAGNLAYRVPSPSGGRNDELAQLVSAFNGMSLDLRDNRARLVQSERIAAWREIAQRIAHEIKNPLTPIQLAVESTRRAYREKRKDFEEIFEESATAILEEVESLKKLVKEFSEFARMAEPVLAPEDVNDTVRNALRVFKGLPEGVRLETVWGEGLPRVALDREQLGRALLNLVANAADAVGPSGSISVRTCPTRDERGAGVEIHVVDDGPGISPADREKIFTPYFTTKSNGTGLGLAITQRIVTDHGGEISVHDVAPHGSHFIVRLRA